MIEIITTVTLNASIDKAYYMDSPIENGTVMRVARCKNSAGGKGLNVARIVKLCGSEVLATGLIGGFNGQYLEHLLQEDGIDYDFGHVAGETRSCLNILDEKYGSTEYLEPGFEVSKQELEEYIDKYRLIVARSSVIIISGSAPKGLPTDIYKILVEIAKESGKQVILDTSGVYLKEGIKALPTMVKPNQEELEALYGTKIETFGDVVLHAKRLVDMGIEYVVVSLGSKGAILGSKEGIFHGVPPKIKPVNTVGCGDSMVAAIGVALQNGSSPQDALAYGVAVATANALSKQTGNFSQEDYQRIIGQVTISELEKRG